MGFAVQDFVKGRYRVRFSYDPADIAAAQRLRADVFRGDARLDDADAFDALCCHALVEEDVTGTLVCCFRMLFLPGGDAIERSYAAQFYDLAKLRRYPGKMVELGRFCVVPVQSQGQTQDPSQGQLDPDILRSAWGALTSLVDAEGVALLFGCSSFEGHDATRYADSFAMLAARHLAPERWRPGLKSPATYPFAAHAEGQHCDRKAALAAMPPLLRTYLMMGGWVSDHAVIDADLGTMHVFTGVEIASIPPHRKKLLRAAAGV
jgi:putative hemolysin